MVRRTQNTWKIIEMFWPHEGLPESERGNAHNQLLWTELKVCALLSLSYCLSPSLSRLPKVSMRFKHLMYIFVLFICVYHLRSMFTIKVKLFSFHNFSVFIILPNLVSFIIKINDNFFVWFCSPGLMTVVYFEKSSWRFTPICVLHLQEWSFQHSTLWQGEGEEKGAGLQPLIPSSLKSSSKELENRLQGWCHWRGWRPAPFSSPVLSITELSAERTTPEDAAHRWRWNIKKISQK